MPSMAELQRLTDKSFDQSCSCQSCEYFELIASQFSESMFKDKGAFHNIVSQILISKFRLFFYSYTTQS